MLTRALAPHDSSSSTAAAASLALATQGAGTFVDPSARYAVAPAA